MANTYRLGPMRRGVNIVMTMMIRIGLGVPSSYLLTTTGRKTGSPRTTPVALVHRDGDQWLVAPLRAGGLGLQRPIRPRGVAPVGPEDPGADGDRGRR